MIANAIGRSHNEDRFSGLVRVSFTHPFTIVDFMIELTNSQANLSQTDCLSSSDWPELILAAREGCNEALGEISKRVRSYLLLVAHDHFQQGVRAKFGASDIVQLSLMEAYEDFGQFKGESEYELCAWIKRIVINNVIDQSQRFTLTQSRDNKREIPLTACTTTADSSQLTASTLMRRQETDVELIQAVAKLSFKQQRVVELRHRFGYSYAEIAEQLDTSEPAVRMLWSRAVSQLKNLLDQMGE